MAQEDPNRFAEWLTLLRRQAPVVRQHAVDWLEAVREEPALIWQTPAVRYAAYGLVGIVLTWGAVRFTRALAPPPPAGVKPEATSADFHVVCADPDCGTHFVIHREFGFDDFPATCPRCSRETGRQALRCDSPECSGRWVAPYRDNDLLTCPHCGRRLE